jgi:hypothetical protein
MLRAALHPTIMLFGVALTTLLASPRAGNEPRLLCTIRGHEENERLGMAMAAAGDVNGDGYADLLVGDTRPSGSGERRCFLFYGKPVLDTIPDVIIPQPHDQGGELFGRVVDGGRDVNGDGYDDIVITSPTWGYGTGKVDMYYGSPYPGVTPDVTIEALDSSWLTIVWLTWLRGRVVGDMNGDGYDELACLVGFVTLDAGAYIYYGGAPMDSVHDLALRGPGYPDLELGSDLADGDVNGDGFGDVAVGAYSLDAAWVYFGGTTTDTIPDVRLWCTDANMQCTVCMPGDFDGDGYDDIAVSHAWEPGYTFYAKGFMFFGGTRMDSLPDLEFTGKNRCGHALGLAGGDINNDGFADLLVSERESYYSDFGHLEIYYGGSEPDTLPDFQMTAPADFGDTVVFLGDMTGDGWAEFAVSNPSGAGEIYIYTMGEVSGDGPEPSALHAGKLRIVPNPSLGMTMIGFDVGRGTEAEVRIFDLAGHLVRRLDSAPHEAETRWLPWDGKANSGLMVPAGTYVVRVLNRDNVITKRIVVSR